jgi:hypothetical protein
MAPSKIVGIILLFNSISVDNNETLKVQQHFILAIMFHRSLNVLSTLSKLLAFPQGCVDHRLRMAALGYSNF